MHISVTLHGIVQSVEQEGHGKASTGLQAMIVAHRRRSKKVAGSALCCVLFRIFKPLHVALAGAVATSGLIAALTVG